MLERDVEKYLKDQVKLKLKGKAYKFVSPGNNGMPDRLIVAPFIPLIMVEVKRPGGKLSKNQIGQHRTLAGFKHRPFVVEGKEDVDILIASLKYRQEGLVL